MESLTAGAHSSACIEKLHLAQRMKIERRRLHFIPIYSLPGGLAFCFLAAPPRLAVGIAENIVSLEIVHRNCDRIEPDQGGSLGLF